MLMGDSVTLDTSLDMELTKRFAKRCIHWLKSKESLGVTCKKIPCTIMSNVMVFELAMIDY